MEINKIHDKVFTCPKCHNKTLYCIEFYNEDANKAREVLGIGYGDICICDECGAELKAEPTYEGYVKFKEIKEDE
jgi:ribosomal protein L37AE/L43A